ncbi:MAG: hypothetical protein IPO14_07345 [Saprospiraceae bacterium]|nr:hypothetical protein [Saprospiraceae bacterium]
MIKYLGFFVISIAWMACGSSSDELGQSNAIRIQIDSLAIKKVDSLKYSWQKECEFYEEVQTPYLFDSIYKARMYEIEQTVH